MRLDDAETAGPRRVSTAPGRPAGSWRSRNALLEVRIRIVHDDGGLGRVTHIDSHAVTVDFGGPKPVKCIGAAKLSPL